MHRKVQVWIVAKGKGVTPQFLLLKTTEERGANWQPITGSVEEGEELESAAVREATEETGLSFNAQPASLALSFQFVDRFGRDIEEWVYLLTTDMENSQVPPVRLDAHEHVDSIWLEPKEALSKIIYESQRKGFEAALDRFERIKRKE